MKQSKKISRITLWSLGLLLLLSVLYLVVTDWMIASLNSEVPPGRDYSKAHASQNELFHVPYVSSAEIVRGNPIHQWTPLATPADISQ